MLTDVSRKPGMQPLIPVLIMAMGIVLMILKMYADSEPGAIPLLLIVTGAVCYVYIRSKMRSKNLKSPRAEV